jgi:microcin C transport system ATP-binding protein
MRSANKDENPLLSVRDLSVAFTQAGETSDGGRPHLVRHRRRRNSGAGGRIRFRQIGFGAVGAQAAALPGGQSSLGQILFKGQDLLSAPEPEMREVRGNDITMIFQEPMTSLNPLQTVEKQIGEILNLHQQIRR